jgi:hypothetical protein
MRRATTTAVAAAACLGLAGLAWAAQGGSTVLRLTRGDHAFQVTLSPGQPAAEHGESITLDLNRIPKVPDPTYGDRVPVQGASLVAVVTKDGDAATAVRYTMHPAGGQGTYGFHWTPETRGLYALAFERRDGDIPEASFKIGVGVATPKQDQGAGDDHQAPPSGAVSGPLMPTSAGPTAAEIMKPMTDPAGFLGDALARRRPSKDDVTSAIAALAAQAKKLPGTCPDNYHIAASDYDAMARQLQQRLAQMSMSASAGQMKQVREQWHQTLADTCTRCHVKFWWAITGDLSTWPKVESHPWRR